MWPNEKYLLIVSNFTFGHNVVKSRLLLLRQIVSAGWKVSQNLYFKITACFVPRRKHLWFMAFVCKIYVSLQIVILYNTFLLNPFPHTAILQQTTLNVFCQKFSKSGKHCGKRRNCSFLAISTFVIMFSKSRLLQRRQKAKTVKKL